MGRAYDWEPLILRNSVRADLLFPESEWGHYFYDDSFCWLWVGSRRHRYGQVSRRLKRGPNKGKSRNEYAHRISIKVLRGRTIKKDYVVRHMCNNKLCVNPMHLRGGSKAQNVADSIAAGTHRSPLVPKDHPSHTSNPVERRYGHG